MSNFESYPILNPVYDQTVRLAYALSWHCGMNSDSITTDDVVELAQDIVTFIEGWSPSDVDYE